MALALTFAAVAVLLAAAAEAPETLLAAAAGPAYSSAAAAAADVAAGLPEQLSRVARVAEFLNWALVQL